MWLGELGGVRGAGGVGRRFSGASVGKGLFEKLAAYVRRARALGRMAITWGT